MARHRHRFHIPFFRIFYSTTYTVLWFIELVLLAITPASLIYTAITSRAFQYIVMVGAVYVLTGILAVVIYTSRLYSNRSVLAGVGKSWIPVEEGEISRNVRKMIAGALERSAIIAWESTPRDLAGETVTMDEYEGDAQAKDKPMASANNNRRFVGRVIKVDPAAPPWGFVQHPGWSSPSELETTTTPHIYFLTVVQELPNLIEARVVSLVPAPPTSESTHAGGASVIPVQTLELLQRPLNASLREYLGQLCSLGFVSPPEAGDHFIALYERTRFSIAAPSEAQFQSLMVAFADLLASIDAPAVSKRASVPATPEVQKATSRAFLAPSDASMTSVSSNDSAIHHRSVRARSPLPPLYAIPSKSSTSSPTHEPQTGPSRPALLHESSQESLGSVVHRPANSRSSGSSASSSLRSARSIIRLTPSPRPGTSPYEWVGGAG